MSWDIAIDGETGDWIFGPDRDFLSVSGIAILRQNIITRLKIPRASFIYDDDGQLGSRLHTAHRMTVSRAASEIPAMVREALADMTEISIHDVQVFSQDVQHSNQLMVRIIYSPVLDEMPEAVEQNQDSLDLVLTVGA